MKIFIDTAELKEIKKFLNIIDGVTTNPSLIASSGRDFLSAVAEICELVMGPVSAEVTATDWQGMLKEGKKLSKISSHVVVKVPLTVDGLKACHALTYDEGVTVNVTLCFSPVQALLAAKAGAAFVSPFVGRLDDIGQDGMQLIDDICQIYSQYDFIKTEVLVASIRNPNHVTIAAKLGAHVATIPPRIIEQMFKHPLTDIGVEKFLSDWQTTGQKIL